MATTPSTPALHLRQYLTLRRLTVNELPLHPVLASLQDNSQTSLTQFLRSVFAEVRRIDFDNGWTDQGNWISNGKTVDMPTQTGHTITLPISVNQRFKRMDRAKWLARRSYHSEKDVKYDVLNRVLNQDHSLNEARYTPSVFDANMLLTWSEDELRAVALELDESNEPLKLEMSSDHAGGWQRHTIQIPVDFESIKQAGSIMERSHVRRQGGSLRYCHTATNGEPTDFQQRRIGNKITEGNYVSLERLQQATGPPINELRIEEPPVDTSHHHRWDMMTLSTAAGISNLAPGSAKDKKILDAISTDVYYVLKFIAAELAGEVMNRDPEESG